MEVDHFCFCSLTSEAKNSYDIALINGKSFKLIPSNVSGLHYLN